MSRLPSTKPNSGRLKPFLIAAGAAAAAAALVVQDRSRRAERENPPLGRFLDIDGVRLHYVERGRGAPLVLLHGNVMTGLDFLLSGLVERAAARYRVIVFDRPGYGYSERPRGGGAWGPEAQARLIRAALARIGAERPIVLGHSWGALVAMAMALEFPRSLRGLVLEAGYYYPTTRPDAVLASPPAVPVLGDLLRFTVSPLLLRASWALLVKGMFAPAEVPERFWRFPPWIACRPAQVRAIAAEAAELVPAAARLGPRYRALAVPAVLLAGGADRVVDPKAQSERLSAELPVCEFEVVPGMGHMLHHLAPDRVLAGIDRTAALAE
jgi:pimeloyl-ACP methyl ester carboxylesterase